MDIADDISFCPGSYITAACPEFHINCSLGRELFTLPTYIHVSILIVPALKRLMSYGSLSTKIECKGVKGQLVTIILSERNSAMRDSACQTTA